MNAPTKRGILPLARQRKGTTRFIGLCGFDALAHQTLVDMGAQCTLMPLGSKGVEPIWISGVTRGSQQLPVLKAVVSLTGDKWQKHPIVIGLEAPCILGINYFRTGYFKNPKRWAFVVAAMDAD